MNQAFSLFRHRKRRPETPIEPRWKAGHQWGVDDDPADHTARSERDESIRECFAELAPEYQAVLALRVMQDLSYDEIAKTLNVPIGTGDVAPSPARVERRNACSNAVGRHMSHLSDDQLSARLDASGAADASAADAADRHLADCAECRERLAALSELDASLKGALAHDPGTRTSRRSRTV